MRLIIISSIRNQFTPQKNKIVFCFEISSKSKHILIYIVIIYIYINKSDVTEKMLYFINVRINATNVSMNI